MKTRKGSIQLRKFFPSHQKKFDPYQLMPRGYQKRRTRPTRQEKMPRVKAVGRRRLIS
jgi:hypothetical protein